MKDLIMSSTHPSRCASFGGWWRDSLYGLSATASDEQLRFADETPHSCTQKNTGKLKSVNITLGRKLADNKTLANIFVSTQFISTVPNHQCTHQNEWRKINNKKHIFYYKNKANNNKIIAKDKTKWNNNYINNTYIKKFYFYNKYNYYY